MFASFLDGDWTRGCTVTMVNKRIEQSQSTNFNKMQMLHGLNQAVIRT